MSVGRTNTGRCNATLADTGRVVRAVALGALFVVTGWAPAKGQSAGEPLVADAQVATLGGLGRYGAIPLPEILSARDVTTYRRAFEAASRGNGAGVEQALAQVQDRRLSGHVRAELYRSASYKTNFPELAAWLQQHADEPDAPTIYALALNRAPRGKAKGLRRPTSESQTLRPAATDLGPGMEPSMPAGRGLKGRDATQAAKLKQQIRTAIRSAELDEADTLVRRADAQRLLSDGERDHIRTQIAAGLFARDDENRALNLAGAAAKRSGDAQPRSHWIAGIAAFSLGRFAEAARHFETLARHPRASGWEISASAFWAGRSHLRAGNFERVNRWFEVAAERPRSFYGLLAHRALGHPLPFNWDPPPVSLDEIATLRRHPGGYRAMMLLQVGQTLRAESELVRVAAAVGPGLHRSLLGLAMRNNMPGLTVRLGRDLADVDGRRFEASTYPVPPWKPADGFTLDPALIYAFMRQESQFNPRAVSPAGARGLMQLMPATAAQLNGGPVSAEELHDPAFNIALGQRYLVMLLQDGMVGGDLIRLAASYNAGPATVARWKQRRDLRDADLRDDPLVAIETLPSPETRHFITRVLYSYWMYSERLGQPTPSLDAVAGGNWPAYVAPYGLTSRPGATNAEAR